MLNLLIAQGSFIGRKIFYEIFKFLRKQIFSILFSLIVKDSVTDTLCVPKRFIKKIGNYLRILQIKQ